MRVLVTGGTGFTGKALVRRLINEGHEVVALDYKEGLATDELRDMGAEVVIGSVADKDVVEKCMQGVDIVQHLAAAFRELDVPNSYYDEINVGGTALSKRDAIGISEINTVDIVSVENSELVIIEVPMH